MTAILGRTVGAFGNVIFLAAALIVANGAPLFAKGGAAKPPVGSVGVGGPPVGATPAPAVPFTGFNAVGPGNIHQFNVVGFIQSATVSSANCPSLPASQWGGTVTVNGVTITVPCNVTLQMPAATFTWADMMTPANGKFVTAGSPADFGLDKNSSGTPYPSIEINVIGNIVGSEYIAGLILVSQQAGNLGQGYIVGIKNANGSLLVGSTPNATPASPGTVELQINDPAGRFSVGQSPDTRFAVDDQNPTIRSLTGYPMCVPRPNATGDDPKCPARNRPLAINGCRNFLFAGVVLPTGRDLAPPVPGQKFCSAFVMPDPATRQPADPDSFQQAPFAIGDYISWQGTLIHNKSGKAPDFVSVHTIVADVGIFTQPGTLPVYVALDEFRVGADTAAIFNGVPQELINRIDVVGVTTDVTSVADVYLMDFDPAGPAGQKAVNRWITPGTMTGGVGTFGSNGQFIDGGITTQFVGPQPGRIRLQANKATPGILQSPTRYIRLVVRQLCDPANINGKAPLVAGPSAAKGTAPCLERVPAANGLMTGQYFAPVFNFIFPENVVPGDPVVPNNLWTMNFLVSGEGAGTGPLIPRPW
jgi:hypothetical protein